MDTKRCCTCKQDFPATTEYFHRSKSHRSGLSPRCKECNKSEARKHYAANSEKTRNRRKERYWENPDKARAATRSYSQEHAVEISAKRKAQHAANPEPKRQRDREYGRKNRHKIRRRQIEWEHRNPDKKRATGQRYVARKNSLPHDFTGEDWQRALAYFNGCCAYCGNPPGLWNRLTAEHYIPVTLGGGTLPTNIVPACQSCNSSKHNTHPDTWIPRKFGNQRAARIKAAIEGYFKSLE